MPRVLSLIVLGLMAVPAGVASGEVVSRPVEIQAAGRPVGARLFENAEPPKAPRAGVLLLHADADPDDNAMTRRATSWARSGRAVLVLPLQANAPRDESRRQASAAVEALRKWPQVSAARLAVVGLDAAGAFALELACSGVELQAVVCGGEVPAPTPDQVRRLASRRVRVLLISDAATPPRRRRDLEDALRKGGVAWRVVRDDPEQPRRVEGAVIAFLVGLESGPALAGRANANAPNAAGPRGDEPAGDPKSRSQARAESETKDAPPALPPGVPAKVGAVLSYVDEHGKAMSGYEGGRTFLNLERQLPRTDRRGRRITYREWDVNPLRPGVNRGAERLVTGSDGAAYYTKDHYESFLEIR